MTDVGPFEVSSWGKHPGAWNGLHLTNTRHLIVDEGHSAVLIEAAADRFLELQRNYTDRTNVVTKQAFVGFTATDGLVALCRETPLPEGL
jgi:hypothetical protein